VILNINAIRFTYCGERPDIGCNDVLIGNTPMSDAILTSPTAEHRHDGGTWGHLVAAVGLALRVHVTRQALPEMPDHLLADIGLSRPTALAEAARLPWDIAPAGRHQANGLQRTLERLRERQLASGPASQAVFWGG
jgi:Domain of unknown function (DUF1127)